MKKILFVGILVAFYCLHNLSFAEDKVYYEYLNPVNKNIKGICHYINFSKPTIGIDWVKEVKAVFHSEAKFSWHENVGAGSLLQKN